MPISCSIILDLNTIGGDLEGCLTHALSGMDRGETEIVFVADPQRFGTLSLPTEINDQPARLVQVPGTALEQLEEAAKLAKGAHLLVLKPYCFIGTHTIRHMIAILNSNMEVGAVGPGFATAEGQPLNSGWGFVEDRFRRIPLSPVPAGQAQESPLGPPHPVSEVGALTLDAIMIRREALWGAGGFTASGGRCTAHLELSFTLRQQGWKVICAEGLIAFKTEGSEDNSIADEVLGLRRLAENWYGVLSTGAVISPDGVLRPHPWSTDHGQRISNLLSPSREEKASVPGESISVVIVTYNSMSTIADCLESVRGTLGVFDEVIVVDNRSQDGTAEFLKSTEGIDPRVRVILSETNLGFSEGCNVGIRAAIADYVTLLNPDTVVFEGWLARMREHFTDSSIAAVGPTSDCVAGMQEMQRHFGLGFEATLTGPEIAQELSRLNSRRPVEVKLLIGFCMMLRRSALDQVGLLDPELFLGSDDLDISWRLRLAGYRLLVATDVFVHHVGHVSFQSEAASKTITLSQNSADHLAGKLLAHYGELPNPLELWGVTWFEPSDGFLASVAEPERIAS